MKIYLASRYSRIEEMQTYADQLYANGHEITSRWIKGNHQISDEGLSIQAEESKRIQFAQEDLEDLSTADIIIAFTEEPRATNSRGGRHVELGYALGLGKQIIIIGHRENVFCCLPEMYWLPGWDTIQIINGIKLIKENTEPKGVKMKWIDANSGIELKEGKKFKNIMGDIEVTRLEASNKPCMTYFKNGVLCNTYAFTIRDNHPKFPREKVAFWET